MLAEPPALLWAFANRVRAGDMKKLRILSGPAMPTAMDSVLALDLADCVERCSMFVSAADRGRVHVGLNYYLPNHFHQLPRLIREHMEADVCDAKGGKSILAFHSTARNGSVSRIVPRLSENAMVTTPRNDTHYLVTEFGAANLKGESTRDRALAIIELAHPKFRDDLLRAAEDMYLV